MRRLYVLGDSISIHYGPFLERMLSGRFSYDRKGGAEEAEKNMDTAAGANGGDSRLVLAFLRGLLESGPAFDVLLLNCGLHDVKTDPESGVRQVPEAEYESNLRAAAGLVLTTGRKVVWVSSTPVDDERHACLQKDFFRYDEDIRRYNEIASGIMAEAGVPVVDLYGFTRSLGAELAGGEIYADHVHFTLEVRRLQAAYIAGALFRERG